ncbi:MAG: pilus assembly protein [Elusimicrobiota bacterium]|jgi:hypothetical protein|nr:pilus assembly protein [Elusimicrobiota bacterium]
MKKTIYTQKNYKAQAILEFTLIIIPFFIIFFGILQILHIAVVKLIVQHATFMTARVAIVDDRLEVINKAARNSIPFKDKNNISVEVISKDNDEEVEVKLTYRLTMIFPIINKIIKDYKNLPNYFFPIEVTYSLPKENFLDF